jgi:hypothetical protein
MFNNGRKVMTIDQVISELRIKRGSDLTICINNISEKNNIKDLKETIRF